MKPRHIFLLAGLCTLGTTLAIAASEPAHSHSRADAAFAEHDSNHDGRLSQSEWQSAQLRRANERFLRMDANRDGSLSREEMQQAARERRQHRRGERRGEKLFERFDANGDGMLSAADLIPLAAALRGARSQSVERAAHVLDSATLGVDVTGDGVVDAMDLAPLLGRLFAQE
jgi:Ca2+-binding EF-hand superfamily protein